MIFSRLVIAGMAATTLGMPHALACEVRDDDVAKLVAVNTEMMKIIATRQEMQADFIKRIMADSDRLSAKDVLNDYVKNFKYSAGQSSPIAQKSSDINEVSTRLMDQCFNRKR
ncbi:hypothetical protein [Methylobacterium oryzisoli]|uniref:hypothetical protein n=1 Tax=Methylobacterium oryzisoli TaxID=3385502 RepID=UPI003891E75E